MDLKLSKKLKGKQEKKDVRCRIVDLNLFRKKYGGWTKLCIWKIKDLQGNRLKKDGLGWIVDLKLSKKWKGLWEKKDGFCGVVYLKCKRITKKKNKKLWGLPSCGFEIN